MIDSYDFGVITVNGRTYRGDLIIFPDRVVDGWWRREGHSIHLGDIEEILKAKPEVLIVGTGYSGMMKVPDEVEDRLRSERIELIAQRTRKACKTYNQLYKSKKAVAALHLTC